MTEKSKPDSGALTIAPPDGYRYSDDHPWTEAEQGQLAKELDDLWKDLRSRAEPRS
jgi:hypothetical protein